MAVFYKLFRNGFFFLITLCTVEQHSRQKDKKSNLFCIVIVVLTDNRFLFRVTVVFLTGAVSYLVAFAILGQDDKEQLTAESVKDFSVRILIVD